MNHQIRSATPSDAEKISQVLLAAFGNEKGQEIDSLVSDLGKDESANPCFSYVATSEEVVIGHILFTHAVVKVPEGDAIRSTLLAPLSVHPDHQRTGIGGQLIQTGLERLRASDAQLAFVLGHPGYYSKHGFAPAGALGFEAPYEIAPQNADAWMVQELAPNILDRFSGKVKCAHALDDPKHWVE